MLQPPTADQLKDPHWAEVHRLMSEATAEEAELSSDEEGAADRLMDGLLPVGALRSRSADGPAGPSGVARRTSEVAPGSQQFQNRLASAFDRLGPAVVTAPPPPSSGYVGPAFSCQSAGHTLAEPAGSDCYARARRAMEGGAQDFETGTEDEPTEEDEPDGGDGAEGAGGEEEEDAIFDHAESEWGRPDENMDEWSSHTSTWAAAVDSDDEDGDGGTRGGVAGGTQAGGGACGSGVGVGSGCSAGRFNGLSDLDALDDDVSMDDSADGGNGGGGGVGGGGVAHKRSADTSAGGSRADDAAAPSPKASKRVRFAGGGVAAAELRRIGLAASDPKIAALLDGKGAAGKACRAQPTAAQMPPPPPRAPPRGGDRGGARSGGGAAPRGGPRAGYTHYSLDDVPAQSDDSNREALAQLWDALGVTRGNEAVDAEPRAATWGRPPPPRPPRRALGGRGAAPAASRHVALSHLDGDEELGEFGEQFAEAGVKRKARGASGGRRYRQQNAGAPPHTDRDADGDAPAAVAAPSSSQLDDLE